MKVINKKKYKVPVFSWCPDIEEGAMEQIENLAQLPFVFKRVAIMPDCHQGYGMPIGGVIATKDIVIPNAVGVDIGCGMCAVKTSLTSIDIEKLKKILGKIREKIPVGFNHNKEMCDESLMPSLSELHTESHQHDKHTLVIPTEFASARTQLGTLGGGNHFIEIQEGSDSHIWIMIHSGSRNLGKKVADYYNRVAVGLNEKWFSSVPKEWELAFLPIDGKAGMDYLAEMQYCVDFAFANRKMMMDRIMEIFSTIISDVGFEPMINIAHNYAKYENHFKTNVIVHRKGATLAAKNTIGIIPGSQGTKSYITEGLGNEDSFKSCSHGAGRKMGRKEAEMVLSLEEEIKKLDDQGILHAIRGVGDLDEASGAYKPIEEVMKNQSDLVKILVALQPLAVIKG